MVEPRSPASDPREIDLTHPERFPDGSARVTEWLGPPPFGPLGSWNAARAAPREAPVRLA